MGAFFWSKYSTAAAPTSAASVRAWACNLHQYQKQIQPSMKNSEVLQLSDSNDGKGFRRDLEGRVFTPMLVSCGGNTHEDPQIEKLEVCKFMISFYMPIRDNPKHIWISLEPTTRWVLCFVGFKETCIAKRLAHCTKHTSIQKIKMYSLRTKALVKITIDFFIHQKGSSSKSKSICILPLHLSSHHIVKYFRGATQQKRTAVQSHSLRDLATLRKEI